MASTTVSGPWPSGTTVAVYPAQSLPAGASSPSGQPVFTGTADANGRVLVEAVQEDLRYVAFGAGRGTQFMVRAETVQSGRLADRARLEELESSQGYVNVTRHGVLAGLGDMAGRLQSLLDSGGGLPLFFPGDSSPYVVSSGVTVPPSTRILLSPDAVVDFSAAASGATLLTIGGGTLAATSAIAGTVSRNDTTIAVGAGVAEDFAPGDWLKLGADIEYVPQASPDGDSASHVFIGEQLQVRSVVAGTITLTGPVMSDVPYTTAGSGFVGKVSHAAGVFIEGGTFRGAPGGNHRFLYGPYARGCTVRGVSCEAFTGRVVYWSNAIGCSVTGCSFDDGLYGSLDYTGFIGYGVAHAWASQDCSVVDNTFVGFRHAIQNGGTTSDHGVNRGHVFAANRISNTLAAAIDTHSASDGLTIIGNKIRGCQGGPNFRGPRVTIVGNEIRQVYAGYAIYARNQTSAPSQYTITGNTIENCYGGVIVYSDQAAQLGGGIDTGGVVVTGNTIDRVIKYGVVLLAKDATPLTTTTNRMRGVTVAGNTIRMSSSADPDDSSDSRRGIYLYGVEEFAVAGNTIRGVASTREAIRLVNSAYGSVGDNSSHAASSSSTSAIYLYDDVHDVTIHDNVDQGFAVGLRSASNTSNCRWRGNISNATTPYSIAGTGHERQPSLATAVASSSVLNGSVFVDSADGKLKFKDLSGTVSALY